MNNIKHNMKQSTKNISKNLNSACDETSQGLLAKIFHTSEHIDTLTPMTN